MSTNKTYSTDNDVQEKYSHITIASKIVVSNYRKDAYADINAELRKLYKVPIDSTDDTDTAYLRSIEAHIAAGNILMAVASTNESDGIHEYGKDLVKTGLDKLKKLADQKIVLAGATRDTLTTDDVVNPPKIIGSSADDYAAFDRPISGIENDAIEGKVDSEAYNENEDVKEVV